MARNLGMPLAGRKSRAGSAGEVFAVFLRLGLTSFGGPIAHLGYYHRELVERRRWVDEAQYGQLLALCQFLPGPASSQLGFVLGLIRAGWPGALAAFTAFTLPSALLLFAFAGATTYLSGPSGQAVVHGLKLVAVAVVADGVRRMARQLTPDAPRALLAAAAAAIAVASDTAVVQLAIVAAGALLGPWVCRSVSAGAGAPIPLGTGRRTGAVLLAVFGLLLVLALVAVESDWPPLVQVAAAFYRAGALVFGGGHVVLPLLQEAVVEPGWVGGEDFLVGYGAAQAVPGPMFSIAAFLGARLEGAPGGAIGALVSLLAILLPGLMLAAGVLPWWSSLAGRPGAARAMAGVNAAVVGLLGAALYDPVWTSAVLDPWDFATALIGFTLLAATRTSTLLVVAWCVGASLLRMAVS